jgi:hypothetical protein
MRYQDFIAELRSHIAEARRLRDLSITHEDSAFREWRHRVESIVAEAATLGYRLPGAFNSKNRFYTDIYHQSDSSIREALVRDVRDSEAELRYLVDQFEKFGVPPLVGAAALPQNDHEATAPAVPYPDRITIDWLTRHVPIGIWALAMGALLAAFLLGVAFGRTPELASTIDWLRALWATSADDV